MTPTDPPIPAPALDYALVRQQYPAAFAALVAYHFTSFPKDKIDAEMTRFDPEARAHFYDDLEYYPRNLYDFFDHSGVYVEIVPVQYTKQIAYYMPGVCVFDDKTSRLFLPQSYPTRVEAEAAAFGAAFEKLEEMLKQEKG